MRFVFSPPSLGENLCSSDLKLAGEKGKEVMGFLTAKIKVLQLRSDRVRTKIK